VQLLGDSAPTLLAISLTGCVGVLAALIALKQTGRPALVWAALGITAVAAAFAAVATQRPGGRPQAEPPAQPAVSELPGPSPIESPTGSPTSPEAPAPVDSATRHANRDAFRSAALARFAAPVIESAQTCQGEEPAGGEREVVVCYLPGDHQVRYLRWGRDADRDRERRQFPVLSGVPTRWTGPDGRWAGALRTAVHDGVEGDYVKVYWDLDCSPVGAVLYGPSSDDPSLPQLRRYWYDSLLRRDLSC
jgi:hypothetical protein